MYALQIQCQFYNAGISTAILFNCNELRHLQRSLFRPQLGIYIYLKKKKEKKKGRLLCILQPLGVITNTIFG